MSLNLTKLNYEIISCQFDDLNFPSDIIYALNRQCKIMTKRYQTNNHFKDNYEFFDRL